MNKQIVRRLFPLVFVLMTGVLYVFCFANDYPVKLFRSASTNENLIISPIVTSFSFAILFLGARGKTANEISEVFGFDNDKGQFASRMKSTLETLNDISTKGKVKLFYAAMLWPSDRKQIQNSFSEEVHSVFGIDIQPLNFSNSGGACQKINNWVSEQTQGTFKSIISPSKIKERTRGIMTGALYFKGKWQLPFSVSQTKPRIFYLKRTDSVSVPTMYQDTKYDYYENENMKVLVLGYASLRISMAILLPSSLNGLSALENSLTMDSLQNWLTDAREREVKVFLPRFKFTYNTDMKRNLSKMGIKTVFDSTAADLTGISDSLFIDEAIQESRIEVNEEGTEATSVGLDAVLRSITGLESKPEPIPVFRANHPFLFVIREYSTNAILFFGKVVNPLKT